MRQNRDRIVSLYCFNWMHCDLSVVSAGTEHVYSLKSEEFVPCGQPVDQEQFASCSLLVKSGVALDQEGESSCAHQKVRTFILGFSSPHAWVFLEGSESHTALDEFTGVSSATEGKKCWQFANLIKRPLHDEEKKREKNRNAVQKHPFKRFL